MDNSSKQMQQTSGSSFCCCGDDDEGFVFISFLSLPPSFLGGRGGGDAVVVVVVCFLLMVYDRYYQPLWLIVRWFDCVLMVGEGTRWSGRLRNLFFQFCKQFCWKKAVGKKGLVGGAHCLGNRLMHTTHDTPQYREDTGCTRWHSFTLTQI